MRFGIARLKNCVFRLALLSPFTTFAADLKRRKDDGITLHTLEPGPALFHLGGFTLRWYSVLWMIAILTGSQVVYHLYKQKGLPLDTFQTLFTYSFIGIFAGARLGHCLFYDPLILPESSAGNHIAGTFPATGRMGVYRICRTGQPRRYAGTDSGTGAFLPENEDSFPRYSGYDGSGCSRSCRIYPTGNLMTSNHRHASDVPWAFIFERVDMQPRHPAQLYEALATSCSS